MPIHPNARKMREEHIALAPVFHSPAVSRCCKAWNREQAASLMHAASVASRAFKLLANTASAAAPRANQRKIKSPAVKLWTGILPI